MLKPEQMPQGYGEDTLVAMAKDPYNVFVYWELTEKTRRMGWERLRSGEDTPVILRLYRVDQRDDQGAPSVIFHRDMPPTTQDWWFRELAPGGVYMAEVGMEHQGLFLALLRSRPVATPPDRPGMRGGIGRSVGRNPRTALFKIFGSHSLTAGPMGERQ